MTVQRCQIGMMVVGILGAVAILSVIGTTALGLLAREQPPLLGHLASGAVGALSSWLVSIPRGGTNGHGRDHDGPQLPHTRAGP